MNVEPADVPESSADAADASDAVQDGSVRRQLFRVFSPLARAHVSYELTIAFEDSHDSAQ